MWIYNLDYCPLDAFEIFFDWSIKCFKIENYILIFVYFYIDTLLFIIDI